MAKRRVQEYVKYTTEELDTYVKTAGSCVHRINTEMHLSMGPFALGDFKRSLLSQLSREHVGFYDTRLDGMILDVKRIKVLGREAAQRADEPRIHVRIKADVYIFKPERGAFLRGLVKHIGAHQIGVILYRVFSANLKLSHTESCDDINLNDTVQFRITNYNLQSYFPSLEGELINLEHDTTTYTTTLGGTEKDSTQKNELNQSDSGMDLRDGITGLSDLLDLLKEESTQKGKSTLNGRSKKTAIKRSRVSRLSDEDEDSASSPPSTLPTKRKSPRKCDQSDSRKKIVSTSFADCNITIKEELID